MPGLVSLIGEAHIGKAKSCPCSVAPSELQQGIAAGSAYIGIDSVRQWRAGPINYLLGPWIATPPPRLDRIAYSFLGPPTWDHLSSSRTNGPQRLFFGL